MTILAATATATWVPSWGLIAVLVLVAAGGWALSLLVHPFTSCRRCNGTGRNTGSTGRAYGRCRSCKGKPERLRFGARLLGRSGRR